MKKLFIVLMVMVSVLTFVACAKKKSNAGSVETTPVETTTEKVSEIETTVGENETTNSIIVPTGFPSGEVQREFLFYNGTLYVYGYEYYIDVNEEEISNKWDGYKYVGKVEKTSDTKTPNEEFEAAHLNIGASIYANAADDSKIIVFDKEVKMFEVVDW